jgi:hypothetical protein
MAMPSYYGYDGRTQLQRSHALLSGCNHSYAFVLSDDSSDDVKETHEGRKGSVIASQYERGQRFPRAGRPIADHYPTNEEIAKAVQQKVSVSCPLHAVHNGPCMITVCMYQ